MSARMDRQPADRSKREHVARVIGIPFFKEEDGYTIASLADGRTAKGTTDPDNFAIGDTYRFLGRWDDGDEKYGPFFRFETYTRHEPATREAVIRYLTKTCDGIGEKTAARLYDQYGAETCKVLRTFPAKAILDGLLKDDVAMEAADALEKIAAYEETKLALFGMFDGRGFPGTLIDRCIETWGVKAPDAIRRNPFTMLVRRLPGCGFKRCDRLWLDLKLPRNALKRQMICGWAEVRRKTESEGDTWHRDLVFTDEIRRNVTPPIAAERALALGIRAGWLASRTDKYNRLWVAEARKARNERDVARHAARLLAGEADTLWPAGPLPGVDAARTPSDHQNAAWDSLRTSPVGILTGGPGTGKTFTVAAVLRLLIEQHGRAAVAVCAPTGKAAVRCTQALHANGVQLRATTIHTLLRIQKAGYDGDGWAFEFCEAKPLPYRFVVVDETSMIDADLMCSLLQACATPAPIPGRPARQLERPAVEPPRCHRELTDPASWKIGYGPACARLVPKDMHRPVAPLELAAGETLPALPEIPVAGTHVLLVGDPDQLPPVGHGAPLRDLIAAGVPTARLTEIRRNAGTIVRACQQVRDKQAVATDERLDLAADDPKNLRLTETADAAQSLQVIEATLANMKLFNPVWQTQVIVALNAKSELSRRALNDRLQKLLNPAGLEVAGNAFRLDDKIICLRNSWMPVVAPMISQLSEQQAVEPNCYQVVADEEGQQLEQYVANGEIGRAIAVGPKVVIARFSEGDTLVKIQLGKKKVAEGEEEEEAGQGCHFDLAYAITVHKAQGSESPCVIVVGDEQAGRVANKEWWYTAISRASKACLVVGSRAVMEKQAKRLGLKRTTFLVDRFREALCPVVK